MSKEYNVERVEGTKLSMSNVLEAGSIVFGRMPDDAEEYILLKVPYMEMYLSVKADAVRRILKENDLMLEEAGKQIMDDLKGKENG